MLDFWIVILTESNEWKDRQFTATLISTEVEKSTEVKSHL